MKRDKKILILGAGNEVLGDESLGIDLVKDLEARKYYPFADFQFTYKGGLDLLEFIEGYKSVIMIDTVESANGAAGKVKNMYSVNFNETLHLSSRHDVDFNTALRIGKKIGFFIPSEIMIITIDIIPDRTLGWQLSQEIELKYLAILTKTKKYIDTFVKQSQSHPMNNKEP